MTKYRSVSRVSRIGQALLLFLGLMVSVSCQQDGGKQVPARAGNETGAAADHPAKAPAAIPPLAGDTPAYQVAGAVPMDEVPPENYPTLHNVYRLSDNIISGGEPLDEAALKRVADMGVKVILSVDGKVPDAETAARYGMKYVHIPIQYRGMTEEERTAIAKTFLELEGPFYVHCFHGKHRGPAAAAWGRVILDGATREEAVAEMRQWCGTSKKYDGLYEAVARADIPSEEELASLKFDFPAAHQFKGFRSVMIGISRVHDDVKLLMDRNWTQDPEHPDLDSMNEARKLLDLFTQGLEMETAAGKPQDYLTWLGESRKYAQDLVDALSERDARGEAAGADAAAAFRQMVNRCDACHAKYRN